MTQVGRRELLKAGAALGSLAVMGQVQVQAQSQQRDSQNTARPSFPAAVMRVPVLVPPTQDAFEDVRRRNAEAMVEAIENLMRSTPVKPRVVVFPVLQYTSARRAVSGVPIETVAVDLVSEHLDQGIFAPVIAACRRHNCYVATSTQEKIPQLPGTYFHTGFIMGPEGLVLRSPKTQAQSAPNVSYLRDIEEEYLKIFGPDSIMPVVDTPVGKLACFVHSEAEVLEASRLLSSKGADLILHTSFESDDTPWQALKQAIGFQCHVFLLTGTTSRVIMADDPAGEWSGGASTIVGPDGRVLVSIGGQDEGFAVAEINLADIDAAKEKFARNTVPAWGLYKDLYRD
ncbi:MAG: nitrilase-related carbon-nitrogen hydrolase [Rhodospirillaceae bacterium]